MVAEDILKILKVEKNNLMRQYPLHSISLFGSYARHENSEKSDIDLMVDVDPTIGIKFVMLAEKLEKLLGKKVDLISKRAIKPSLMRIIEKEKMDA